MKEKRIVVVGSCNTDMVVRVDHLPLPGETIIGYDFITNQGGKGANQAVRYLLWHESVQILLGNIPLNFSKRKALMFLS